MKKKIRLGLVGAGRIAKRQIESLRMNPDVEIAAICARNPDNLKHVCECYSIPRFTIDFEELLSQKDIDAVSICTPNNLHCAQTLDALESGKHVLVEKPMARTVQEAELMEEASRRTGKLLQVGFQERFSPAARAVKAQIDGGFLGDPIYVRVQALRRRGIPNWGVYGRKDVQGGGPLIDIGVHMLEMAHYLIGAPVPVSASGAAYRYFGSRKDETVCRWPDWDWENYDVEDLAAGFIRFDTGCTLSIETSFVAHIEKNIFSVQIMGTAGGATTDPLRFHSDSNGYMLDSVPAHIHETSGFDYKLAHFIDCIRNGNPCEATARDGILIQKMIEGLYRSAEVGNEVTVK